MKPSIGEVDKLEGAGLGLRCTEKFDMPEMIDFLEIEIRNFVMRLGKGDRSNRVNDIEDNYNVGKNHS